MLSNVLYFCVCLLIIIWLYFFFFLIKKKRKLNKFEKTNQLDKAIEVKRKVTKRKIDLIWISSILMIICIFIVLGKEVF